MRKLFFSITLGLVVVGALPLLAQAQGAGNYPGAGNPQTNTSNNPPTGSSVSLDNPLTGDSTSISPQVLIGRIISLALGLVGSLALLMFVYGGFIWMTSSGNQERVEQGKRILIWATAGLALIFLSYALVNFIIYQGILGRESAGSSGIESPGLDPGNEIGTGE